MTDEIARRPLLVEPERLPPREARRFRIVTSLWTPVILSFSAAFVDAVFFLGLFQTFVAFITGTIIVVVTELAAGTSAPGAKLAVLPAFVAGLAMWVGIVKAMRRAGFQVLLHYAVLTQAALLAAVALFALRVSPLSTPDGLSTLAVTVGAVFAMSLQTAAMAMLLHFHTPTTMMTGNTTNLMVQLLDAGSASRYWAGSPPKAPRPVLIKRYGAAVSGFLAGAAAGAAGWVQAGFAALVVPAALLAALGVAIVAAGWWREAAEGPRGG